MPDDAEDPEVVFNRVNVALARSQRIIQSWLGPQGDAGANLWDQDEDDEDFKPTPETLGVGSKLPDVDLGIGGRRRPLGTNDKLLEQLLGKKAAKEHLAKTRASKTQEANAQQQPINRLVRPDDDGGDSEEEGRAGAFNSKKSRKRPFDQTITEKNDPLDGDVNEGTGAGQNGGGSKRQYKASKEKPTSYLDQLLAEKAAKKRKKGKGS
ncbi:hypothetical protein CAC42_5087 [Sphaceloma murrayae]|uniref:Uncharacterized protein n=1 Tax=Sphaceloma murrayae TaxID=2082308 RepID=A0A2K1QU04_9PEZI|nr:hypothetical protein CAC42_5087 [Sphaceloma murrayae]